jgi:hypothetical protein
MSETVARQWPCKGAVLIYIEHARVAFLTQPLRGEVPTAARRGDRPRHSLIGISFRGKKWLAISDQSRRDSCFFEACQLRHSNMRLSKVHVAILKLPERQIACGVCLITVPKEAYLS